MVGLGDMEALGGSYSRERVCALIQAFADDVAECGANLVEAHDAAHALAVSCVRELDANVRAASEGRAEVSVRDGRVVVEVPGELPGDAGAGDRLSVVEGGRA